MRTWIQVESVSYKRGGQSPSSPASFLSLSSSSSSASASSSSLLYSFADLSRFTHTLPSKCSSPSSPLLPLSSALSLPLLSTTQTGPVNSSRDRPQALLSTTATITADKLSLDPARPASAPAQLSSTTTPTASNALAQITTTSGSTTAAP